MSVQTFECQIVKAQIGRYLAGEMLSKEAQLQLEAHISRCAACSADLAERRSTLQALLTKPVATPAPSAGSPILPKKPSLIEIIKAKASLPDAALVDFPAEDQAPVMGSQRVLAALEQTPAISWKPLAYSGALALVLILMSTIAKDPTKVFGPRATTAGAILPSSPEVAPEVPLTLSDIVPAPFTSLVEGYEPNAANNRLTLENSKALLGVGSSPRVAAVAKPVIQRPPSTQPISINPPTRRVRRPVIRRNRPTAPANSVRVVPNPKPAEAGSGIRIYNP